VPVREFPALGFDPAPGDAAALSSAAADVTGAGKVFSDASANVSKLNSSAWTGDAADAFRSQLDDLPRDLGLAADSHRTAARALSDYGTGWSPGSGGPPTSSRARPTCAGASSPRWPRSTGWPGRPRRPAARSSPG
jgi:hypothetical protein